MNIGRITARYKNIVLENKILVERALGTLGLLVTEDKKKQKMKSGNVV